MCGVLILIFWVLCLSLSSLSSSSSPPRMSRGKRFGRHSWAIFLFLKVKERLQVEEHPVSASTYFLRQVKL